MEGKVLSIVIPVYKVEDYLHRCVDSIIDAITGQESKTEIILVNDGSPDSCGNICDEYAKKYNFISVIHKENGGLSDARNTGIKAATGKFLCFIDSDDYLDKSFFKVYNLLNSNGECDFFKFPYVEVPANKVKNANVTCYNTVQKVSGKTIKKIIDIKNYRNAAWLRIVKRQHIVDNNNWFLDRRIAEDFPWSVSLLLDSNAVCFSDTPYYHYMCEREGSIMNSYKLKNFTDIILSGNELVQRLNERGLDRKTYKAYYSIIAKATIANIVHINKLTGEDRAAAIALFKENKHLVKHAATLPYRGVRLAIRVLGVKATLKLLSIAGK